ncbi:helix-turn-helix transcriptional regulator [Krasilnikovia sp. MM14-A1259]|uniref:helix-turn-helix transcriptional regulator n=1 Tax=Krasilnikovia sp. MM14-A1259 TaxID=3373539 RepID=UPI00382EB5E2
MVGVRLHLMGTHEIRVRLGGVSRQRTYQITSRRDFPRPIAESEQGKVWLADDVETWMSAHRPRLSELDELPAVATGDSIGN